ncbi:MULTISPECIES: DUF3152 domain-containing protein [unclassified Streptomyces]|uniref:DUF3152 domain-containing protein n=1 Tax=unclassified Streptomyces TaxID=2593676 RepID=UPI002E2847D5|nr:DUF3152 domain-containing protein [Streptomyces sp. NBC_01429]
MGRHSRKGSAPQDAPGATDVGRGAPGTGEGAGTGNGRRRRGGAVPGVDGHVPPPYETPAHGVAQVRGGHPEQREPGGGWGSTQRYGDWQGGPARAPLQGAAPGAAAPPRGAPQSRPGPREQGADRPVVPGPRREFIDAFDAADTFEAPVARTITRQGAPARGFPAQAPGTGTGTTTDERPTGAGPADERTADGRDGAGAGDGTGGDTAPGDSDPRDPAKGGKGRALTGIAAAAVTTVLAVVVAGQVTDGGSEPTGTQAAGELDRTDRSGDASRSDGRTTPTPAGSAGAGAPAAPTYAQLMTQQFDLDADLTASGEFSAVPGLAKAPGKGQKFRYRVDIENGLGLDGELFADAVQKTLNDDRSWAHNGAMTFERVSSGQPDFVITLASPGTTGFWCDKSGLDTTVDNVSCDSAATDRVMINAFRWAQGAKTFGAKSMHSYRQMLINHEVGHRLGHNHESCRTPGALAPVMQQQTKTLDIDGIKCRPNPWVFPTA